MFCGLDVIEVARIENNFSKKQSTKSALGEGVDAFLMHVVVVV